MIPSSCVRSLTESFRFENSRRHLSHSSHWTSTPALRSCCSLGEYVNVFVFFSQLEMGGHFQWCEYHMHQQTGCNGLLDPSLDLGENESPWSDYCPFGVACRSRNHLSHTSSHRKSSDVLGNNGHRRLASLAYLMGWLACITHVQAVIYQADNIPESLHCIVAGTFEHRKGFAFQFESTSQIGQKLQRWLKGGFNFTAPLFLCCLT